MPSGASSLAKKQASSTSDFLNFPDAKPTDPVKPNKQYYVAALASGKTVGIHDTKVYPTFFKLFRRYCDKHGLKYRLHLRQQKPDLWLLIPRKPKDKKPDFTLEGDFREHGRYKYYARQLEEGAQLSFSDRAEANKVRRAWHWYVPKKERSSRRCAITALPKSRKFVVSIQDREE